MTARHYSVPAATSRSLLAKGLVARVVRGLESVGTVAVLFIISGAVFPLLRGGADPAGLSSPPTGIERLSTWAAYLFVLLQVAVRPRALLGAAMRNPLVPGFVLVAFLSIAWSDDPGNSLKEAAGLSIWTLFGLYLVSRYSTEDLLRHLGAVLGALAVLSLVFGLAVPEYGIAYSKDEVAWRGVFIQKNQLGHSMLLASVVFALLARTRHSWRRVTAWLFLALALVLIVLCHSKMALVILCALAVIMPAVVSLRRGGRTSIAALGVLLAIATAITIGVTQREPVLNAIGKDATLTGRTDLWAAVGQSIAKRPLLGYGYKAFWEQGTGSSEVVRAAVGWDAPHSHNAFLDLWLDLGMVGLLTLLAGYLVATQRAWFVLRARPGLDGLWALTILIMLIPLDMVASPIYEDRLIWTLFVAVSVLRTALSAGMPRSLELTRPHDRHA